MSRFNFRVGRFCAAQGGVVAHVVEEVALHEIRAEVDVFVDKILQSEVEWVVWIVKSFFSSFIF
jgi:hypothetical protein